MDIKPEAVSVAGAARLLAVHPETVRRLIRRRQLEAFRVGRVYRIRYAVLRAYHAAHLTTEHN